MEKPDKILIRKCIKGDKSAQYELVRCYAAELMRVCRRYARDEGMAEDILQEAWIKIFRNLSSFNGTGSFRGWLHRITVNTALQWIKKTYLQRESQTIELIDRSEGPPLALKRLQAEDISRLIQGLPNGFREVFNLYVIDGYRHKEIAALLGINESTSRTMLLRARNLLQRAVLRNQPKKAAV